MRITYQPLQGLTRPIFCKKSCTKCPFDEIGSWYRSRLCLLAKINLCQKQNRAIKKSKFNCSSRDKKSNNSNLASVAEANRLTPSDMVTGPGSVKCIHLNELSYTFDSDQYAVNFPRHTTVHCTPSAPHRMHCTPSAPHSYSVMYDAPNRSAHHTE